MHLGEGQYHFADELALGGRQLEEGVESFAFQIADAFISALAMLLH